MAGTSGWRELGPPARPRADLEPSGFSRLALVHALAMAGDALVTLALAGSLFFSISPTAARGRVMLSLILTMAPFAVVAPFLGPAIDRARAGRRAMVVLTAVGRAVACLAMARVVNGLLLFPAAFVVLVLSKSYSVAKSSMVPSLVDDESLLVEANSKLSIVSGVAGFVAALPGVALLQLLGARWTLWLAASAFSAATVAGMRLPRETAPVPTLDAGVVSGDRPAGPRSSPPPVRSIETAAVATALLRTMVGFLTFLVAFGFRRAGAPSWQYGVVLAVSAGANLAGAGIAPLLRTRLREEWSLAASLAVVGLVGFFTARADGILWAAVIAGAIGAGAAVGKLSFDSIVQRDAHDSVRGQSFARYEAGFQLVWVVGALLPVLVATPLHQGYTVIGIAGVAGSLAYGVAQRRAGRVAA